jgi:hypothetical protein
MLRTSFPARSRFQDVLVADAPPMKQLGDLAA